jgi:hypothetical protein
VALLATIDICTPARSGDTLDEPVPCTVIVRSSSRANTDVLSKSRVTMEKILRMFGLQNNNDRLKRRY